MGIVKTAEWKLTCPPGDADRRVRAALVDLSLTPEGEPGNITTQSKRSLMKNRWAATLSADVRGTDSGSLVLWSVDMAGNKHYALLDEIAEKVGDDVFDVVDNGIASAVDRLGATDRILGRKELRHLINLLADDESVLELGQGTFGGKQGLVALTTLRLFFFEKGFAHETLEALPLTSITSLSASKGMTSSTLDVYASGQERKIEKMKRDQAQAIVSAYQRVATASPPAATAAPMPAVATPAARADDPIAQLERLAVLRDKGVISQDEYYAKKADLMGRI